ncbi:MAE_28990/MAE_18760 family HEPN-like nuclease [Plesiomonas shigelloides]|uniref:MAE_28990/MAE_18760 family HEPN-like nuclease n=1 Tax=Plesiomonas shigelloides TaxID=703 RepID=UPI000A0F5080|nr:MAE_28990/MAE_18760 family HEPN-like nuclease [Plesiomonas shigelloides]
MTEMTSKILFDERKNDIIKYFDFVKLIVDKRASLTYRDTIANEDVNINIDLGMTHILKANTYLLLYNLVEATISNAIEDIHEKLENHPDLCIDKLRSELTTMALKKLNNMGSNIITSIDVTNGEVAKLILKTWLSEHKKLVSNNKNPLFSGNVDARKIRTVAEDYGFSCNTNLAETGNGYQLVTIKEARNSLAHGSESFLNKGQDTSIDTLESMKNQTFSYLEDILNNIQQYIDGQCYLR